MVVAVVTPGESGVAGVQARLETWQDQLAAHFSSLHLGRRGSGDWPVFGLEHGLELGQVEVLKADIRQHIGWRAPVRNTWLPWVVYAAELGYVYSGNEYWQTFENETPGWLAHGSREWIRTCFSRFHQQYGGIRPTGDWAEWFSIISWPIAHAILPRDFQYQLAKILYDLRYAPEILASAETLGSRIQRQALASSASKRFREFTEDTALVGQIALALLFQGEETAEGLLLQSTVQRIVADLELMQGARDWLQRARRNARAILVRGLAPGTRLARTTSTGANQRRDDAKERAASLAIEPRLLLRPTGHDSWEVRLEIPNLSPIVPNFPGARELLENFPSRVAGCTGRPLARGQLLSLGGLQVVLSRWPRPQAVLVEFSQPVPPELAFLLRCECLLRPGPRWLFRVAKDGRAYEIRSLLVRAGERYVVLSSEDPLPARLGARLVSVGCDGVHGIEFEVPAAVSGAREAYYRELGVQVSHQAEAWPAGVVAAQWDNEGYAEWLEDDEPCLGIRVDHVVSSLFIQLDGEDGPDLDLHPSEAGEMLFVILPALSVGSHRLRVWSQRLGETEFRVLGELVMRVREKRPWTPGLTEQNALFVTVDPPFPTMEQVWSNSVLIDIQGPAGARVRPSVAFLGSTPANAPQVVTLPELSIPVTAEDWKAIVQRNLRGTPRVEEAERLAASCSIELDAGEVGHFKLLCQRADKSLHWILLDGTRPYRLTLTNLPPDGSGVSVARYRFDTPDTACSVAAVDLSRPWRVDDSGGLFVADSVDGKISVIVSPSINLLQGGSTICPRFDNALSRAQLESVLSILQVWKTADTHGNAVSLWAVQQVELAAIDAIFGHIAGEGWRRAEGEFLRGSLYSGDALERFRRAIVTRKRPDIRLADAIGCEYSRLIGAAPPERARALGAMASRTLPLGFNVRVKEARSAGIVWLAEFALRLASAPGTIPEWSSQNMTIGLSTLVAVPALARAARFLVLCIDRAHADQPPPSSTGALYAGWEWE